jgi:diacylglycerol kinase family enzyme
LIVNPVAGLINQKLLKHFTFADKEGLNLALYTTTGIDDIAKIKVLYDTLKNRVIVAGGDGTIKSVAESLENVDVVLNNSCRFC